MTDAAGVKCRFCHEVGDATTWWCSARGSSGLGVFLCDGFIVIAGEEGFLQAGMNNVKGIRETARQ